MREDTLVYAYMQHCCARLCVCDCPGLETFLDCGADVPSYSMSGPPLTFNEMNQIKMHAMLGY